MLKRAILSSLPKDKVRILVVGNSSADLDSVVSAICHAYFYNTYHDTNTCFPFIDIDSQELRLRKDVTHVLNKFRIDKSHIFFQDDLKRDDSLINNVKLIYVDHNSSQNATLLRNEVVQIIDHHDDEGLSPLASPRIIERCGSCASLVFNYWFHLISNSHKKEQLNSIVSTIADLILAPILMDTSNMTQKVEEPDIAAVRDITNFTTLNTTNFFQEIHQEKLNIEGLTIYELLQKDFKSLSPSAVGFSSLAKSFEYILLNNAKDGTLFEEEVKRFVSDLGLKALVMMTSYEETEFEREIAFYIEDANINSLLVPHLIEELRLQPKFAIGNLQIYQQLNIKASRKQVLPLVKSLVS